MIHVVEGKRIRIVNCMLSPHAASITLSLQPARRRLHARYLEGTAPLYLLFLHYLQFVRGNKKYILQYKGFQLLKPAPRKRRPRFPMQAASRPAQTSLRAPSARKVKENKELSLSSRITLRPDYQENIFHV